MIDDRKPFSGLHVWWLLSVNQTNLVSAWRAEALVHSLVFQGHRLWRLYQLVIECP